MVRGFSPSRANFAAVLESSHDQPWSFFLYGEASKSPISEAIQPKSSAGICFPRTCQGMRSIVSGDAKHVSRLVSLMLAQQGKPLASVAKRQKRAAKTSHMQIFPRKGNIQCDKSWVGKPIVSTGTRYLKEYNVANSTGHCCCPYEDFWCGIRAGVQPYPVLYRRMQSAEPKPCFETHHKTTGSSPGRQELKIMLAIRARSLLG
ncbi:hypothetical protein DER46DRAFT_352383 [Fusarium sp. MPI-SDFR-AT-0072]|nr:hypothetical protein DER46DRAFT_352383 [Fusarium sp. MPI-SDFR-AT-0072]